MSLVGACLDLDVGDPAQGGSCVARHDGQVVFVRHALPGERVRAVVTDQTTRYLRADAVEVVRASPHRVVGRCPLAVPGGCGGCDWQHADGQYQRELKAAVVAQQLRTVAKLERDVVVEPLPGDGYGWRTRVRFAVDAHGRLGFRRFRSHEVVAVEHCPIAHPLLAQAALESRSWSRASEVEVGVSTSTRACVVGELRHDGERRLHGADHVVEEAVGRRWRVSAGAFWQVHPGAADALSEAVAAGLRPQAGERALDLFAGVGLFAATLAAGVGPAGQVTAVESSAAAVRDARTNLADLPQVRVVHATVAHALARLPADAGGGAAVDLVVLDPPRAGAGAQVVRHVCRLRPRAIAYAACDPATLARDLVTFGAHGYGLAQLRALDLFPQTHHVECVALLRPSADGVPELRP